MCATCSNLLYELKARDLRRGAEDQRYPKWSSMCLLRLLGYPVLNACCVWPTQGSNRIQCAAQRLTAAIGTDRVMLRSDGGVETAEYHRGGSTFAINELRRRAEPLLEAGRAVLLIEPTDRFANRFSAVIRIDRESRLSHGRFIMEALGPGYDVSDLNRGGIQPQLTVTIGDIDWWRYRELWWSDLQVSIRVSPHQERQRRRQRLIRLASDILPDIGEISPTSDPSVAQAWLRSRGYDGLWHQWDPMIIIREIRRWYEDAFILGNALKTRDWRCLSIGMSKLAHRGIVYWDIVDGQRKFGTSPRP